MKPFHRLLLLAAAACGLTFAFAPFPLRPLAFIGLIPLLATIEARSVRRNFLWAWLFGSLAAGFHLWWVWFLVIPVEPVTRVLLNVGVTVMFAYIGLYTGVFAVVVRRLGLWTAPFVWVLLEYARSTLQIAFPWDFVGYAMTPWVPFIQPAALGGVYLVSAWVVLVNILILRLLIPWRRPTRHRLALAAGLVLAFALPLILWAARVRPLERWFRVAIIQPNVAPDDKGDWESREQIQANLVRMSEEAARDNPDLIVFPETATLSDVTRSSTIGHALRGLVDSLGIEILTGSPLYDQPHGTWHNGAVLLRPHEDSVLQRHYKMRLVPFSEKVPYADELPFLRKLISTADMGNWGRGRELRVFDWRLGTLSNLICYEAIFPELTRAAVRLGSQLLVVETNDGWFGRLPGIHQHAEIAVMRTVETGAPMVRSANNGISFIVDPFGRVLKRTGLFQQAILAGDVPRPLPPTPYARWGDRFLQLSLGVVLVAAIIRIARRRRA